MKYSNWFFIYSTCNNFLLDFFFIIIIILLLLLNCFFFLQNRLRFLSVRFANDIFLQGEIIFFRLASFNPYTFLWYANVLHAHDYMLWVYIMWESVVYYVDGWFWWLMRTNQTYKIRLNWFAYKLNAWKAR